MIKSVKVTNYMGESLTIPLIWNGGPFEIEKIEGLGPPKATINTTEIATNDGSKFNSARATERNVVVYLILHGAPTIEDARQLSYKYFPVKKPLQLEIETDNRRCVVEGYPESNEPNIFSDSEDTQVSIVCPNPYWKSAGDDGIREVIFHGVAPNFEFPFSNESLTEDKIEFGIIERRKENVVYYDGDAEQGVTITIEAVGTVKGLTIYNIRTREKMAISHDELVSFTGSGIVNGDTIIISTVKGHKTIDLLRNGVTTNILNCIGKDDDWFMLSKGDNIFGYTADEGSDYLDFKINYSSLYEGI